MTRLPDDLDALWHTTGVGREEYLQRLLGMLVVGGPVAPWNVPQAPSRLGHLFLTRLHEQTFDDRVIGSLEFVDEFELPRRHEAEHAGWPDYGVVWPDRVFLIELKSERRSHRPGQLEHYLDLATHHHGPTPVSLLHLTPAMTVESPDAPHGASFRHWTWADTWPLTDEIWGASEIAREREIVERLGEWIADVEAGTPVPTKEPAGVATPGVPPYVEADEDLVRDAMRPPRRCRRTAASAH